MRVVFAGTPAFSVPALRLLAAHSDPHSAPHSERPITLAGVYTQPDRPAGRGKKPRMSAVKEFASARSLPIFQPPSFTDSALEQLRALRPDLIVVIAYGLLLPPEMLAIPRLGCVNLHASLLPRWRGAAPIQRAIAAGDATTGVCLMAMDSGIDTGAVLAQATIPITAKDTSGSLHARLADLARDLLHANLQPMATQTLIGVAQDESHACYASKLDKTESQLDWQQSAATLERKIRALYPKPAAWGSLDGIRLGLLQGGLSNIPHTAAPHTHVQIDAPPGEIIRVTPTGIAVATGDGVLILQRVQKPGGREMAVRDLLNGMKIVPGMRFCRRN